MIPLRDVIPSRTTPYITITIIALNAVAWIFEILLPHEALNEFLTIYGVVPALNSCIRNQKPSSTVAGSSTTCRKIHGISVSTRECG